MEFRKEVRTTYLHELGHYYAGRLFKVRAETFSVGFGKELWHRIDKRGTRWRVAAFPLGGRSRPCVEFSFARGMVFTRG